ncbi:Hypothetical predicted protein [Podarcis lilfordi]|uniref:Uncharacterized protein n=1 Tax=Podarcis lilfordi TaxID=74358 RepID=A0AA35L1B5_9SAUR|nr:Hypothetical predicted protein [Podarcis lilfordi]
MTRQPRRSSPHLGKRVEALFVCQSRPGIPNKTPRAELLFLPTEPCPFKCALSPPSACRNNLFAAGRCAGSAHAPLGCGAPPLALGCGEKEEEAELEEEMRVLEGRARRAAGCSSSASRGALFFGGELFG